jgi:hypothetical protein
MAWSAQSLISEQMSEPELEAHHKPLVLLRSQVEPAETRLAVLQPYDLNTRPQLRVVGIIPQREVEHIPRSQPLAFKADASTTDVMNDSAAAENGQGRAAAGTLFLPPVRIGLCLTGAGYLRWFQRSLLRW